MYEITKIEANSVNKREISILHLLAMPSVCTRLRLSTRAVASQEQLQLANMLKELISD